GTEELFERARHRGVTVVWIDANAPHAWQRLDPGRGLPGRSADGRAQPDGSGSRAHVGEVVRQLLEVPSPQPPPGPHSPRRRADSLARFYREGQPRWRLAVAWTLFRDLAADRAWRFPELRVREFEEAVLQEWPRLPGAAHGSDAEQPAATSVAEIVDRL